jgi:hypothetical protein
MPNPPVPTWKEIQSAPLAGAARRTRLMSAVAKNRICR